MICYNCAALQMGASRVIAASPKIQISNLKFEIEGRRGKSEHQRAASPLTAGRLGKSQISDLKFEIVEIRDARATTSATENRPAAMNQILRSQI